MKLKIILSILLMFVLINSFAYAWGCDNEHCKVTAGSIYVSDVEVTDVPNRQNQTYINFYTDLNYINGVKSLYEFDEYHIYYFNNWYSSKYIDLDPNYLYFEIQPRDPDSASICKVNNRWEDNTNAVNWCSYQKNQTSCESEDICEWHDTDIFQQVNYLGLPFYIRRCYVDCDYTGDIHSCERDGDYSAMYDFPLDESHADIINLNGNYYTNDTYSELITTPGFLRGIGQARVDITHSCEYNDLLNHNVQVWCDLAPNLAYRHNSATHDDWTYKEIIPGKFPTQSFKYPGVSSCVNVGINMSDNTFNPYNWTIAQITNAITTNKNINDDLSSMYSTQSLIKQVRSNNELIELSHRLSWQVSILTVVDVVASIILLIYYVLVISILSGILFVQFPKMMRKSINTFREFTRIRRKE